jgi:hypothetical protein
MPGKNPNNAGRKLAARFQFRKGHPLSATHKWPIMIQHTVPNIVCSIPRYPGPRPQPLTQEWKFAARTFAYHIMLLCKPWEGPNCIPPPSALTWKAMHKWLNQLRAAPANDIASCAQYTASIRHHCSTLPKNLPGASQTYRQVQVQVSRRHTI